MCPGRVPGLKDVPIRPEIQRAKLLHTVDIVLINFVTFPFPPRDSKTNLTVRYDRIPDGRRIKRVRPAVRSESKWIRFKKRRLEILARKRSRAPGNPSARKAPRTSRAGPGAHVRCRIRLYPMVYYASCVKFSVISPRLKPNARRLYPLRY